MRLRSIDRVLAWTTWVVAALLALMLLIGPRVVANDNGQAVKATAPYPGGGAAGPAGQALFKNSCGSCHTLSAAGTSGAVGPKLDGLRLDAKTVRQFMHEGPGLMPSFDGQFSPAQTAAIAAFVARASG